MPFTEQYHLPTVEELSVPEIKLTSSALKAASIHMGQYCDNPSKEFMLCKKEFNQDPRSCINEGKEVTRCGNEFLKQVKKACADSFQEYWKCLDMQHGMKFRHCRKYQQIFDECMKEKLGQDRPELQYFTKVRLHDSVRPKPSPQELPEPIYEFDESKPVPPPKRYAGAGFGR